MRALGWSLVVAAALALLIALGPRPTVTEPDRATLADAVPHDPLDAAAWLAARDADLDLPPGAESRVRWAGSPGERAPLALVVLHGFSASPRELHPLPAQVADALGAHVVYQRLDGHGLDGEALAGATAEAWLADAERGYTVGTRIADRVVLLTSSTGGTLGLWLQLRHRADPRLLGAVHLSPNLGLRSAAAEATRLPWLGPVITSVVTEHCFDVRSEDHARYWTECYPTPAVLPLVGLVSHVRGLPLQRIPQPTALIWSADDRAIQADRVEALAAILPRAEPHPWTPEPGEDSHVLAGDIVSPGGTPRVRQVLVEAIRRWTARD